MKMFSMYVKTVISNEENKILLLKENRMDKKPRWDLPGTILTDDDSFDEAVINNVQKEIGYYVYPGKIIGVTQYTDHDIKEIHVIMTGNILSGESLLSDNYEDYKWIPLNRITDYPLKDWLNHYIKNSEEPFHDVTREIEKLESLEDTRKEISNDSFFKNSQNNQQSFEPIETENNKSNKSSFSLLKDTIKRTFHPKKAEITQTEPKTNLFTPESEQKSTSITEKLNIKPKTTPDEEEDIIIETDDLPVDEELLAKINSQTDEIIIEHEGVKTTTPSEDIIIEPATEDKTSDEIIDKKTIEEKSEKIDAKSDEDKYAVKRIKQDSVSQVTKPKKDVFNMNINHENNMKKQHVKRIQTPKVDDSQDIKVIHNNEKTPYIRKEKESSQKVSFDSESIKRHGWKEKLDELNRTDANKQKKRVPRPKGQRRN